MGSIEELREKLMVLFKLSENYQLSQTRTPCPHTMSGLKYRRLDGICNYLSTIENDIDYTQVYNMFFYIKSTSMIGFCTCKEEHMHLVSLYKISRCILHKYILGIEFEPHPTDPSMDYKLNLKQFKQAILYYNSLYFKQIGL